MSVLGPYVLTDCSERSTEASTTVGYVTNQYKTHWTSKETCLRLPDRKSCPGKSREHMTTPSHSDRDNLAMYVVLYRLIRRASLQQLCAILLFYPALPLHRRLIFCLSLRDAIRHVVFLAWLLVLHAIMGDAHSPCIRTFGGRVDGGRRYRPIRHGALPQLMAAFARAHLTTGRYAARSSC
jgi:hypothetical protein